MKVNRERNNVAYKEGIALLEALPAEKCWYEKLQS